MRVVAVEDVFDGKGACVFVLPVADADCLFTATVYEQGDLRKHAEVREEVPDDAVNVGDAHGEHGETELLVKRAKLAAVDQTRAQPKLVLTYLNHTLLRLELAVTEPRQLK